MKKIILIICFVMTASVNAQVIIGDALGSATIKTSVLLDFALGQNKGLILPYVRTMPTLPAGGTIVLDATSATAARVKFYNDSSWLDLSGQDANVTSALADQPTAAQAPEPVSAKAIMGADSSSADGVLVLQSTTKAMILPIVDNVLNILSPSPGMMVYVNKAGAKRLAVFNGNKWSFWSKQ
ncbi:hypothetical protein PGH12_09720 [Chryseobacterium wangxinyae]|uniref:hypothetical protein n=1 Tax=Chryseobacterium sp. CY350 TaxID=2997336 RepID=UPI002270089F|nr:hypothetical protein [Chryseobacterium sp. CY350]MCY0978859.1 hypothetical protein [Chryseobacterium sp. CY350]WBZ93764.1 hypothetical protein PGH12_09720 [Chryseobacterium sp. CY350]